MWAGELGNAVPPNASQIHILDTLTVQMDLIFVSEPRETLRHSSFRTVARIQEKEKQLAIVRRGLAETPFKGHILII